MPYVSREYKRIQLPSNKDYWVDIVTSYTYGERKAMDEALTKDGFAHADTVLLQIIKDWNIDGEGGVLEINAENIELLGEEDVVAIFDQAKDVRVEEDPESKKNSTESSEATTADTKS